MRCSARPSAASTKVPPSDRFPRTRPHHHRSGSSPSARQGFSAGGCAGSAGRRHSSTILRSGRSPCRTCSHAASAPASEPCSGKLEAIRRKNQNEVPARSTFGVENGLNANTLLDLGKRFPSAGKEDNDEQNELCRSLRNALRR